MSARPDEYAAALRQLEQLHRDGVYGDAEYELKKARLIAEATRRPLPLVVRFVLAVAAIVIIFIVIVFIVSLIGRFAS